MKRICLIDIPGLSEKLLSAVPEPSRLGKWLAKQIVRPLVPSWPAVTCSVQATITTGTEPSEHGIIANGIATYRSIADQQLIDASNFASYRRDVSFWEQSNQFVQRNRFWQDDAGTSRYKTALLFFQNSMPGFISPLKPAADIVITPKPVHGADGRLTNLLWTEPRGLADAIGAAHGPFPLMKYWGPMAGIESSQWIARAAARVWTAHRPTLQFVYVPHLDYDLQRFGPDSPQASQAVAAVSAALEPLIDSVESESDGQIILLSEYAMQSVSRSIQPNKLLADAGLLVTRDSADGKLVDYARSEAFAMCDHQVAHVFVRDAGKTQAVWEVLSVDGAMQRLERETTLAHHRAGDLLLESATDAWFDYRWWDAADRSAAPRFATSVDIHRKPGYDPLELFFDPAIQGITEDASRIRGSHGAASAGNALIVGRLDGSARKIKATDVASIVNEQLV